MSETVDVYFMNGHMAKLTKDNLIVESEPLDKEIYPKFLDKGAVFVNWNNVCMIRETPEPKKDDDWE